MDRADRATPRQMWLVAFYDQAELNSLGLSAYLALGDYLSAEKHAHRCLSTLRPQMARSRPSPRPVWRTPNSPRATSTWPPKWR
jgi:hypothetical protein